MAFRSGNDYRVAIGYEADLGSGYTHDAESGGSHDYSNRWDDLHLLSAKLSFAPDRQLNETGYKSGSAQPSEYDFCQGVYDGTFTLEGNLSPKYRILLGAFFGVKVESTGNHSFAFLDKPLTPKSLVMMQIWPDALTPATNYKVDIAKGCVIEQLVIGGTAKGVITYTATGRFTDHERKLTMEIKGVDKGLPLPACTQFGKAQYSGSYGETTRMSAFMLTMRNIFTDENNRFANSMTRSNDTVLRQEADLNIVSISNDEPAELDPMRSRGKDVSHEYISVTDNNGDYWTFTVQAVLESLDLADPDRALFETNVNLRAVYNQEFGFDAVSIATSVGA